MKTTRDPNQYTPTREELAVEIVRALDKEGWSLDAITAFLVAQNTDGVLRSNCPPWKRQTCLFLLTHGRLYTAADLENWEEFATSSIGEIRWTIAPD